MQEAIYIVRDNIYFTWFALLVFFLGFCASYVVYDLKIKALMWFPHWFMKFLSRWVNPKAKFIRIFLVIFLFNSISIMLYMISGIFIIVPAIIAFLTGMNIGITVFLPPMTNIEGFEVRQLRGPGHALKFILFSTLVLVLEVLVFSVALGMGMSLGSAVSTLTDSGLGSALFIAELLALRLNAYFTLCVPVLAASAYMEASVIKGV